jgi:hypothetical protein
MHRWRAFLLAFALGFAVALGQQAVALHEMGHVLEDISKNDSKAPHSHEGCSVCAALANAVPTQGITLPDAATVAVHSIFFDGGRDPSSPRLAFRSRAPPRSA